MNRSPQTVQDGTFGGRMHRKLTALSDVDESRVTDTVTMLARLHSKIDQRFFPVRSQIHVSIRA
jgi:hypothetical protein